MKYTIKIGNPRLLEVGLELRVPDEANLIAKELNQKAIPAIAKDTLLAEQIEKAVQQLPSTHELIVDDSRSALASIPDASVHLVVTSPPYWTLKEYVNAEGQLGFVDDYDEFLDQLDDVWRNVYRVLVPGGRAVIVVGDVCLSRRQYGRHVVFPLHASIQDRCRKIGFDNLAPIIWHKISNAQTEVSRSSSFLGKPYEPNGIIKHDIEYVLFERKPGGYRKVDLPTRLLSVIPEERHKEWFQQIWSIGGASTKDHPAPYPLALAERLVRMFSFVGDVVLDPFSGTGTTSLAAARWGRNSIGVEVVQEYVEIAKARLLKEVKTFSLRFPNSGSGIRKDRTGRLPQKAV
ncbi:MAG: site-specific DNA-methyltransferase [Chloroflexi bacterium]|nr:MAG: site-specific DNA-methyltransferase [Chloroflexota bacterium]